VRRHVVMCRGDVKCVRCVRPAGARCADQLCETHQHTAVRRIAGRVIRKLLSQYEPMLAGP
jgi:hypothetical protein